MENLILKGTVTIDGVTFQDIEGGFGPGKKALLAKDIATIHGKEASEINRRINDNRGRFIDGVDIIDLKDAEFVMLLKQNGIMSQNAINVSKNIYLLSERGYSKLLKLLEDDMAWLQYDKLIDGYFEMKQEISENLSELSPQAALNMQMAKVIAQNDLRLKAVEEKVEKNSTKFSGVYKRLDGISYHVSEVEDTAEYLESGYHDLLREYRSLKAQYSTLDTNFKKAISLLTFSGNSFKSTVMKLIQEYAPGHASMILNKAADLLMRENRINLELRFRHYRARMAKNGYTEEEINKASRLEALEACRYNRERTLFLEAVKKVLAEGIGQLSLHEI